MPSLAVSGIFPGLLTPRAQGFDRAPGAFPTLLPAATDVDRAHALGRERLPEEGVHVLPPVGGIALEAVGDPGDIGVVEKIEVAPAFPGRRFRPA